MKELEKGKADTTHSQRKKVTGGESYTIGGLRLNDYSRLNCKRSCIQLGTQSVVVNV